MQKNCAFLFTLLFYTLSLQSSMPSFLPYPPYTQEKDSLLQGDRHSIEFKKYITLAGTVKNNNGEDIRCFQYALEKITGYPIRIPLCANIYSVEQENGNPFVKYLVKKIIPRTFLIPLQFPIERFFEQTKDPQPNGLVIYTTNKYIRDCIHFAVIIDGPIIDGGTFNGGVFESKFGDDEEIWRHRLFDIWHNYGNAAWFFDLKEKYKTPAGKKELFKNMEQAEHEACEYNLQQMNDCLKVYDNLESILSAILKPFLNNPEDPEIDYL
jgi:hypothetical protein